MNQNQISHAGSHCKKSIVLLVSVLLLIAVAVTETVAFLVATSGEVTNQFTMTEVPNRVDEDFDGSVKENVKITNTGTTASYIRAAVVVTWAKADADGNPTGQVHSSVPVLGVDYTMEMAMTGWIQGEDDYYYYTLSVDPNESTDILISKCQPIVAAGSDKTTNQPDGYVLSVEIMGQSVQAGGLGTVDGTQQPPVLIAWGDSNGSVTGVNNGTLTIDPKEVG